MRLLALAFAAGLTLVACDGGSTGTGGTGGSTTSSGTAGDGGMAGSTSSVGGGGTGGQTGGTGGTTTSSTGGAPAFGSCGRKCVMDADCCPAGTPGCPGPYPANFACIEKDGEKVCRGPQCATNADCEGTGLVGYECKSVFGVSMSCIDPCLTDGDCPSPTTCVGMADDGTKYCTIDSPPFMCMPNDGQCDGYGECAASGDKCVCQTDDDCADTNFLKDCVGVGK